MNNSKPKAQSTPNFMIKGRKNIKDRDASDTSPIFKPQSALPAEPGLSETRSPSKSPRAVRGVSPENFCNDAELSQSDSDVSELQENDDNFVAPETATQDRPIVKNTRQCSSQGSRLLPFIVVVTVLTAQCLGYFYFTPDNECENWSRNQLYEALKPAKLQDLNQEAAFWRGIAVQIDEVHNLDSPRSIVFLYEPEGLQKLQKILKIVAKAAACRLRCCGKEAVRLNSSRINSQHIFKDYGVLIETYRPYLEESGVLVMENLDQISGQVAQAFHSFCDDSSPVVDKALIVFTVRVKKLSIVSESADVLRNILSANWEDIGKSDKFEPLFARIAGHIELVQS